MEFSTLKNALAYVTLHNNEKYREANMIQRLDLRLCSVNVELQVHRNILKNTDNKLLYMIKIQEEAQEDIETEYQGEKIDIGFNVSYLLDVLANLKNESIQICLGDSNSSAVITLPGQEGFKYVVMPMRI